MKKINLVKNYWNKKPCNIGHSKKKLYSKEYFNEVRKKRYFVESHIPKFANFKKYKNKNVLEIGCGIGTDAVEFIKSGANYIGTELSNSSLDICKKRIKELNLEKFEPKFISCNAEKISKIKKLNIDYDLIYSFGVIHHSPNMKKIFDNIHKLSKKNTEIKIMLYAKNSFKNLMLNITKYRYEAQKGCPIYYRVDEKDLKKLTYKKFKILNIEQDFIFPYQIKPYKKNTYKKIGYFQAMPNKIFKRLSEKLGEHMLITLKKI